MYLWHFCFVGFLAGGKEIALCMFASFGWCFWVPWHLLKIVLYSSIMISKTSKPWCHYVWKYNTLDHPQVEYKGLHESQITIPNSDWQIVIQANNLDILAWPGFMLHGANQPRSCVWDGRWWLTPITHFVFCMLLGVSVWYFLCLLDYQNVKHCRMLPTMSGAIGRANLQSSHSMITTSKNTIHKLQW